MILGDYRSTVAMLFCFRIQECLVTDRDRNRVSRKQNARLKRFNAKSSRGVQIAVGGRALA